VTSATVQTVGYGINCNGITAETQVAYTAPTATLVAPPAPAVTLTSNTSTQTVGNSVTLTWNAQNTSGCTASGGVGGDAWTGALPPTGSMQITESSAGANTYGITCTGAPPAAKAQVTVNFAGAPSSSASGGGGGGGMGGVSLLFLSISLLLRQGLRRAAPASRHAGNANLAITDG
jgi:hypothetical protein